MSAPLTLVLFVLSLAGCRCGEDRIRSVTELADAGCEGSACTGPIQPGCTSTAEVCNGVDDDCDGQIDDGLRPTTCGVGECQHVVASCEAGHVASCNPTEGATAEVCDGKDNDCDGTVDEDLISNLSKDQRITNDPASSDYVYAAWNGSRFGVAWQDKRDGANGDNYFVPLDEKGQRLKSSDVRITNTSTYTSYPALAWSGQSFGLVYSDGPTNNADLYLQRITEDGAKIGSAVKVSDAAGNSSWPDIAWTGHVYGVSWADQRGGPAEDLYFRLIGADGTAQTGEIRITPDPAKQQSPILKWNGSEFGVAWTDFRHGNRRRGTRIGSDVRITNALGESTNPSIDWNGYQYGLSWQDDRNSTRPSIYFAAVNAQGVKNGGDLKVSTGTGASAYTTALGNGTTYGFAWRDDRDGNMEIYFAYVGCP